MLMTPKNKLSIYASNVWKQTRGKVWQAKSNKMAKVILMEYVQTSRKIKAL